MAVGICAVRLVFTRPRALSAERGGRALVGLHEGLPPGLTLAYNEAGWRDSLSRLAVLMEAPEQAP